MGVIEDLENEFQQSLNPRRGVSVLDDLESEFQAQLKQPKMDYLTPGDMHGGEPFEPSGEPIIRPKQFIEGAKDVARSTMGGIAAGYKSGFLKPQIQPGIDTFGPEYNDQMAQAASTVAKSPSIAPDKSMQPKNWGESFARAVPQFGGQIVTSMASPVAGVTGMGLQIAGGTYNDLIEKGVPEKEAAIWGLANASMQAPLEQIGISKALSSFGKPIFTALKAAGAEAFTEFFQKFPDEFVNIFAPNPDKTLLEKSAQYIKQLPQTAKEGLYEASIAAPMALIPGAAGAISGRGEVVQDEKQDAQPNPFIADLQSGAVTADQLKAMRDRVPPAMRSGIDEAIAQYQPKTVFDEIEEEYQQGSFGKTGRPSTAKESADILSQAPMAPAEQSYEVFEREGLTEEPIVQRQKQNQQAIDRTNIDAENEISRNEMARKQLADEAAQRKARAQEVSILVDVLASSEDPSARQAIANEIKKRAQETPRPEAEKPSGAGRGKNIAAAPVPSSPQEAQQPSPAQLDSPLVAAGEGIQKFNLPPAETVTERIPDFKNTNEAVDFGKNATHEQIKEIERLRSETQAREAELKAAKDFSDERTQNAYRGQLYREALEAAAGTHPLVRDKRTPEQMTEYGAKVGRKVTAMEPSEMAAPATKEPWEQSQQEYVESRFETEAEKGIGRQAPREYVRKHRDSVRKRLEDEWYDVTEKAFIEGRQVAPNAVPVWAISAEQMAARSDDTLDGYLRQSHREAVKTAVSDGKPVPASVLSAYPDLQVKATPPTLTDPSGKERQEAPQAMTEEEYLSSVGLSRQDIGESALHKNRGGKSDKQWAKTVDAQAAKDRELITKRDAARKDYADKIASGELRAPTRTEQLIRTAQGHEDNEATMSARRVLEKRGIKWESPVQQPASVQEKRTLPEVEQSRKPINGVQKSGRREQAAAPGEVGMVERRSQDRGTPERRDIGERRAVGRTVKQNPEEAPQKPKALGRVWTGNQWRPYVETQEIKRGKKKGMIRVTLPGGKRIVVDAKSLKSSSDKPIFSRRNPQEHGTQKAKDLSIKIVRITSAWANSPAVEVVQSQSELPGDILDHLKSIGAENDIVDGTFYHGTVYLVADNLASEKSAVNTMLHESFGHYGLRELLGPQFKMVLRQVYAAKKAEADAIGKEYGFDMSNQNGRIQAADEWLARHVSENEQSTWIDKVVAAIRSFVRRVAPSLKFSDAEIRSLLDAARASVVEGGAKSLVDESAPAFAKAYHGTPHIWPPEKGFPHGRPRLDKIGTGEGAASYGWGWYSAEEKTVAGRYAEVLRPLTEVRSLTVGGVPLYHNGDPVDYSPYQFTKNPTERDYVRAQIQEDLLINEWKLREAFDKKGVIGVVDMAREVINDRIEMANDDNPKAVPHLKAILKKLNEGDNSVKFNKGESQLYTLDIPDDVIPKLLDWDKPLSEQSEYVKKALRRAYDSSSGDLKKVLNHSWDSADSGEALYADLSEFLSEKDEPAGNGWTGFRQTLNDRVANQKAASEYLASIGIPGNKYLDQMSRDKGNNKVEFSKESNTWDVVDGKGNLLAEFVTKAEAEKAASRTSNFVIWDQKVLDRIALLERNGEKLDAMREGAQFSRRENQPEKPEGGQRYKDTILIDDGTSEHGDSVFGDDWGDINSYKELHIAYDGTEGSSWVDGHKEYAHIKNPVARIRLTHRREDGSDLLVEEIQPPSKQEQAKMPAKVRNRMYDIAIRHLVSYAAKNEINSIMLPDADALQVSMGWETGNLSNLYDKILPSKLTKLLGDPEETYVGNFEVKYWNVDQNDDPIPTHTSQPGKAGTEPSFSRRKEDSDNTEFDQEAYDFAVKYFGKEKADKEFGLDKKERTESKRLNGRFEEIRSAINRPLNDFMYWIVDKNHPIQEVQAKLSKVTESIDVFLKETQRPKVTANRVKELWANEVKPLIEAIAKSGKNVSYLEEYAHAKHAQEANIDARDKNAKRFLDALIEALPAKITKPLRDEMAVATENKRKSAKTKGVFEGVGLTGEDNYKYLEKSFEQFADENATKQIKKNWESFTGIDETQDSVGKLSGMSNAEAKDILDKYHSDTVMERLRKNLASINNNRLELLMDAGLIPQEEYDAIKSKFEYYVPLQREGFDDSVFGASRGLNPTGKPIKVRGGSKRNVVNIIGNSVASYEKAINLAEKAASTRVLRDLVKNNPDPTLWTLKTEKKAPRLDQYGNVRMYPDIFNVSDNEFRFMSDGKQYILEVNRDNRDLMLMLRTLKAADTSYGPIMNSLAKVNQWLAKINTTWSPEFIISNFARDFQTANINIQDTGVKGKNMLSGAGKAVNAIWRVEKGKQKGDELEKLYDRFKKAGGKIGWSDIHGSVANLEKSISKDVEVLQGKRPILATARKFAETVGAANTAIENGIRLHVFKLAAGKGMTDIKAAKIASDITVDFTKKGAAGPVINSLYLFANAGIQGSYRIIRAARRSSGVRKTLAGIVGTGFTFGILNAMVGGDDDDNEDYYSKIEDYVRERNAIFMIPGSKGKYLKIPLPWGYNLFWNIGTEAALAFTRKNYKPIDGAARLAVNFANAFNPIQSGTLLQTLAPTIADPFAQVAENKNWFGGPLMPGDNPFDKVPDPDSQRYWKSSRKPSVWVASQLNTLTGGDNIKKGAIDVSPATLDLILDTVGGSMARFFADMGAVPLKKLRGEEVQISKIPFVRRVFGEKAEWSDSRTYFENIQEILTVKEQLEAYAGSDYFRNLSSQTKPQQAMFGAAVQTEKNLRRLRRVKKALEASGNKEQVKNIEKIIDEQYKTFNSMYDKTVN